MGKPAGSPSDGPGTCALKVLLDNCIPRPFERQLAGHEVIHCSRLGWERLTNGKLLSAAEENLFAVLVTVDQGMRHQQNMSGRKIAVIQLRVLRNDLATLNPMAERGLVSLTDVRPGAVVTLEHPDWR